MEAEELEVPTPQQLNNIMKSFYNFEDEMVEENKGYASYLQLMAEIKKLKEFNTKLGLLLMEATPYSP